MLHVGERYRQMANVIDVEMVVIYGRQNMGHGPIHDFHIQIVYLGGNILRQIPGVLEIDGAHNDLQLLYGLFIDHIALRLAPVKHVLTYSVLEKFHVLRGKESFTQRGLLTIPPEHIILEIPFYGCVRLEPRNDELGYIIARKDDPAILFTGSVCSVR